MNLFDFFSQPSTEINLPLDTQVGAQPIIKDPAFLQKECLDAEADPLEQSIFVSGTKNAQQTLVPAGA